jgi:hypothetical protein
VVLRSALVDDGAADCPQAIELGIVLFDGPGGDEYSEFCHGVFLVTSLDRPS